LEHEDGFGCGRECVVFYRINKMDRIYRRGKKKGRDGRASGEVVFTK